jgi:hypothetical protein
VVKYSLIFQVKDQCANIVLIQRIATDVVNTIAITGDCQGVMSAKVLEVVSGMRQLVIETTTAAAVTAHSGDSIG